MNKKIILIVLLLISLSFIYQNIKITGYAYKIGESFESGGRTIIIHKISQSNAVIGVDGIKNIISVGDYKNVNGVRVEVINVFFVTEEDSRSVDLSITVLRPSSCGDGICEYDENSENCCIDCGCPADYACENNECKSTIPVECRKHEDCDDGDSTTIDLCVDLTPKTCKHYTGIGEDIKQETGELEEEEQEEIEEIEVGFFSKLINFLKSLF